MKYWSSPFQRRGRDEIKHSILLTMLILTACGGGSTAPPTQPRQDAVELFDTLWDDFDRNYSFFQLKEIDWDNSRTQFRSRLARTSSDRELFNVLSELLLQLEDPHVRLDAPLGASVYTGWYDQYPENFDESVIVATYLGAGAELSPQTNMLFGRIDADIGYMRVHSLGGTGHGSDVDYILDRLAGISALVIDLRGNGGGDDRQGVAIAARFADTQRLYRRVRYRDGPGHGDFGPYIDDFISPDGVQRFAGPVAILTNRHVLSSAESLVLAFDVLPQARRIGDYTGGGSANPALRTLANSWQYTVSRWIEYRPDGTTFEGVGIEPDVRIDISSVDAIEQRDTILETALADLHARMEQSM